MNPQMNSQMNSQMNPQMNSQMNPQMNPQTNPQTKTNETPVMNTVASVDLEQILKDDNTTASTQTSSTEMYNDQIWLGTIQAPLMSLMVKSHCDIHHTGKVQVSKIPDSSVNYSVTDKRNIRINIVQTGNSPIINDITIQYSFPKLKETQVKGEGEVTDTSKLENPEIDLTTQTPFPTEQEVLKEVKQEVQQSVADQVVVDDLSDSTSETDTHDGVSNVVTN